MYKILFFFNCRWNYEITFKFNQIKHIIVNSLYTLDDKMYILKLDHFFYLDF